jgi:hypothetical protein
MPSKFGLSKPVHFLWKNLLSSSSTSSSSSSALVTSHTDYEPVVNQESQIISHTSTHEPLALSPTIDSQDTTYPANKSNDSENDPNGLNEISSANTTTVYKSESINFNLLSNKRERSIEPNESGAVAIFGKKHVTEKIFKPKFYDRFKHYSTTDTIQRITKRE